MDRMSVSFSKPQLAYLRADGISAGDLIRRIINQHRSVATAHAKASGRSARN
jgi:hypothetical protein